MVYFLSCRWLQVKVKESKAYTKIPASQHEEKLDLIHLGIPLGQVVQQLKNQV
jgi:hypothetical protein